MCEAYVRYMLQRNVGLICQETKVPGKEKHKSHKKYKKDKDGIKIKNNKDKKEKNKNKSEKNRIKEERQELKENIKKERNEKKKQKLAEGLVPNLTLKLGSSNSNLPMPPSSADIFKLNIKPVVKKTEDESPFMKEDTVSHEHCHSPELAQISALVIRQPKQKHSLKLQSGSLLSKNSRRTPLSKKGHFDEETASMSEEPTLPQPSDSVEKPLVPLPTPYYMDKYGIKIWVCPACRRPDNGSPMIGCDGCDSWYHFLCVGITEEPEISEDWYCKACANGSVKFRDCI